MKLEQLGLKLGLVVRGDGSQVVDRVATIEAAGPDDLSFVVGRKYSRQLRESQAGAVIVSEAMLADAPGNALISANPYASYAKASWLLHPPSPTTPGIHPSAVIHANASVDSSASIGPYVTVGEQSYIGANTVVGAHCEVGAKVEIGAACRLFPKVILYDNVKLGNECRIQSGAIIGSEGFGYAWADEQWQPIHQVGGVRIGDRVHVGANTTIDCGTIEPTVIEDGVILDNQIQIAHNVRIGRNTAIAGCVGIAGSTRIGSHCQIGGACNIVGHLHIADEVVINAASLVSRSIEFKGRYGSGMPLMEERAWRRSFVNLSKLDDLFAKVRRLDRCKQD